MIFFNQKAVEEITLQRLKFINGYRAVYEKQNDVDGAKIIVEKRGVIEPGYGILKHFCYIEHIRNINPLTH